MRYLRWGGDAEGGAPFVYADPADPQRDIGFEIDLADELGRHLAGLGVVTPDLAHQPRFIGVGVERTDLTGGAVEGVAEHVGDRLLGRQHVVGVAECGGEGDDRPGLLPGSKCEVSVVVGFPPL